MTLSIAWRTRAELAAALTATERERDLALGKARVAADDADRRVEANIARIKRAACAFDEDANHIDRLKVNVGPGMNAQQRRALADTLRGIADDAARDIEEGS
jgi:hypothetical protein